MNQAQEPSHPFYPGDIVHIKAGMPFWEKIPMNLTEGFGYMILDYDVMIVLTRKHNTTPVTIWQVAGMGKENARGFFMSEPLLEQFMEKAPLYK